MTEPARDADIRARIEAAADAMPQVPVRWGRVTRLARRKALLSVLGTLAVGAAVAVLLLYGGSVGRAKLHPGEGSPFPIPFAGVSVPDVTGMTELAARETLERAGLKGAAGNHCALSERCRVRYTRPARGSNVLSGALITLYRAAPVSPPPPPPKPPAPPPPPPPHHHHQPPPPPHGAASIELTLSPAEVPADGRSTSTVKATVHDQNGHPEAGQLVTFSPSDSAVRVGSVSESSPGVYTATLTSSTTAGMVRVLARDGSVKGEVTLTQTPGPVPDAAASIELTLESTPSRIANVASGTVAVAKVLDKNGNPVAHQTVEFSPSGLFGEPVEREAGVYAATIANTKRPRPVTIVARDGTIAGEAVLRPNEPTPSKEVTTPAGAEDSGSG